MPGRPRASHAAGSSGIFFCSMVTSPASASLTAARRVASMCCRQSFAVNSRRGISEGQQVFDAPRSSHVRSSADSSSPSRSASAAFRFALGMGRRSGMGRRGRCSVRRAGGAAWVRAHPEKKTAVVSRLSTIDVSLLYAMQKSTTRPLQNMASLRETILSIPKRGSQKRFLAAVVRCSSRASCLPLQAGRTRRRMGRASTTRRTI